MSIQGNLIAYGSFTSAGTATSLEIPSGVSYFEIENRSTWGTGPAAVVKSWWQTGMANDSALQISESGANALTAGVITTLGVTPVDYSDPQIGGASAITAITAASPAVASSATTANVGDIVRIYGTTGMLQVAGYDFTVTATNPGVTMTLGYLPAAGFAAAATAGFWRKLSPYDLQFYPRKRYITAITQAASAVVTLSVTHGYAIGQKIRFHVGSAFGMTEIDGLLGTITAINTTTNTLTVDIDSSGFSAFAFPTSAITAAQKPTPAHIVPVGEATTILTGAVSNEGYRGLYLGTGVVGASTNVMQWRAYKGTAL